MRSLKILVFAGSVRRESYNKQLAKLAYEILKSENIETTFLDLKDCPMPLYDSDLEEAEGLPRAAKAFKEKLAAHDAFLIASPEYNGAYTPLLKNSLDWASRAEGEQEKASQVFAGKRAALISASPSALGGVRGLIALRMYLSNLGLTLIPTQLTVAKANEAFDEKGHLKDVGTQGRLKRLCLELAERT